MLIIILLLWVLNAPKQWTSRTKMHEAHKTYLTSISIPFVCYNTWYLKGKQQNHRVTRVCVTKYTTLQTYWLCHLSVFRTFITLFFVSFRFIWGNLTLSGTYNFKYNISSSIIRNNTILNKKPAVGWSLTFQNQP